MRSLSHKILCVGRKAQCPWLDAVERYRRMLGPLTRLDVVQIRDSQPEKERQALWDRLEPQAFVVALDERGRALSTKQWSEALTEVGRVGRRQVLWVIGGAEGLGDAIRSRADALWQLSSLTLPHRAARAVLVEQLFRVYAHDRGLAYHREG